MYIVSANYRDRLSAYKWLVRDSKEPAGKAKAYKSVIASGVTFGESGEYEAGFGRSQVAKAESVILSGPEGSEAVRIKFNGFYFFLPDGESGDRVVALEQMVLKADGSMAGNVPTLDND